MADFKKAEESLSKLPMSGSSTCPPPTVAAAHYVGDEPEKLSYELIDRFARDSDLCKKSRMSGITASITPTPWMRQASTGTRHG
jgi:hypothetical protein